ncbi:non-ribosomal peptide synthetase [Chitinophaga sp. S165]|uniref:non-ribosomal peptide synthetase n=1 Tax=Chitinophaga sp. S165 TaxID=2135462 RepID=UPI000D708FBA|nr:non-ribosomal peptide synthetase [Chitinophaga sp. S165]PWV56295.1 non-ribosomal peptide synthase protein (TIGR01720 family)/amino acid adenylation domain-containing protein [Chitinophaga sp. S165]
MSIHCISPVQKKYFSRGWNQSLLHRALFKISGLVTQDVAARWKQLVNRHAILRTVSTYTNNVSIPFQDITDQDQTTITVVDNKDRDMEDILTAWRNMSTDNGRIRLVIFNNEKGSPAYVGIIAPTVWLDSWSLRFLAWQLVAANDQDEEPLQFIQYVEWLENTAGDNETLPAELEQGAVHFRGTLTLQEGEAHAGDPSCITADVNADETLLRRLQQVAKQKNVTPADIWYWAWTNITTSYLKQGIGTAAYISSGRQFDEFKQIPGPFAKGIYSSFRKEQPQDVLKLKEKRERFDLYREQFECGTLPNACTCSFEYLEREHFPEAVWAEMPACVESHSCPEPFILSFFAEDTADSTRIVLQADKNAISASSLEWIRQTLLQYIVGFTSGEGMLSTAPMHVLSGAEVPFEFVALPDMLMATAGRYPDHIALEWEEGEMTYQELVRQSRQIAEVLIVKHGLAAGDRVLLNMARTEKLIPVIWAVMFSGATYIPADKQYPEARIRYIMQQSDAKLAVTDDPLADKGISPEELFRQAAKVTIKQRDLPRWKPDQPVYILYTSGTTGQPKGCVITMNNLLYYTGWATNYYFSNSAAGKMPLFTPIAFDLTVTSVFCTLLRGATLFICSEEGAVTEHLKDAFTRMNAIKLTPSHIRMLPYLEISGAMTDTCIVGGEALQELDITILRSLNPAMRIYNEYGPTECTVGCIVWEVPESYDDILIGKPISNTQAHILNARTESCMPGIEGEIWIGGNTVGAGYFNDAEKTTERFINGLYRTGDIGYWLPDGNICYTGRNDDMIKVRGYRIEPGEIAAVMRSVGGVSDAFVMVLDEELVGYYTGDAGLADAIRKELELELPAYMQPGSLVALAKFPVNVNGKLDITALPSPKEVRAKKESVPPRTPQEKMLAQVWELVLQKSSIGIHDHFLGIGGDSIKAIQVVAKMREKGWSLQVGDILRYPTISQLVDYLKEADHIPADDLADGGEVPLTPLQIKFFTDNTKDLHHYNQSVLLQAKARIAVTDIKAAVSGLWQRHAALRTVFPLVGNERVQQVLPAADMPDSCFREEPVIDLKAQTHYWQQQFDLETGPLFRCILFHEEEYDVVFLLAHHLIIDGVSWRIILEQLAEDPSGKDSTAACYLKWSQAMRKRTDSLTVPEMSHWMRMEAKATEDWIGFTSVQKSYQHYDHVNEVLSAGTTSQLLALPLHAMKVNMQEVLLAALTSAIHDWSGKPAVTLYIESHGRNSTDDAASFADTVGWFTMKYPVMLPCIAGDVHTGIQQTIAALEQVPGNGEGYLCQRYLGELQETDHGAEPLITFNYLGQIESVGGGLYTIHPLSASQQNVGPDIYMPSALFFTLIVSEGALQISLSYHNALFTQNSASQLIGKYIIALEQFIDALEKGGGMFKKKISGADGLGLNEQELEEILNSI